MILILKRLYWNQHNLSWSISGQNGVDHVMMLPIVEEISEEFAGKITVAKVDVDGSPSTAAKFGIRNIPTILFFKDGKVADKQVGAVPKNSLVEKINKLL